MILLTCVLTVAGQADNAHIAATNGPKLTSQHELAIWQPAWPTINQQKSVLNHAHEGVDREGGRGGGGRMLVRTRDGEKEDGQAHR